MPILKNAHRALIDERKLIDTCSTQLIRAAATKLACSRPPSATIVPASANLIEQIRHAIFRHEVVFLRRDRHGRHYRVDLILAGPVGTAHVRTGWIYDRGSDVPRLSAAFVLESADQADG